MIWSVICWSWNNGKTKPYSFNSCKNHKIHVFVSEGQKPPTDWESTHEDVNACAFSFQSKIKNSWIYPDLTAFFSPNSRSNSSCKAAWTASFRDSNSPSLPPILRLSQTQSSGPVGAAGAPEAAAADASSCVQTHTHSHTHAKQQRWENRWSFCREKHSRAETWRLKSTELIDSRPQSIFVVFHVTQKEAGNFETWPAVWAGR